MARGGNCSNCGNEAAFICLCAEVLLCAGMCLANHIIENPGTVHSTIPVSMSDVLTSGLTEEDIIRRNAIALNLVGQPGSTPKELFDTVVEHLKEEIKEQRAAFLEALGPFPLSTGTTYSEVIERVQGHESYQSIDEGLRLVVFRVLQDEAALKEKKRALKHKKAVIRFKDFLRSLPNIASTSRYEEFESSITESLPRFKRLADSEMKTLFDRYVHRLKEEELSLDIEPGEIKRRPTKREHKDKGYRRDHRYRHRSRSEDSRHKKLKH